MPLHVFQRDELGHLIPKEGGGYEHTLLPLFGEIQPTDFCISNDEDFATYGLTHAWLNANFDQGVQWVQEGQDYAEKAEELAGFLSSKENIKGLILLLKVQ